MVFVRFKGREIPKSASLQTKLVSRRTLSGFRSPWAMPFGLLEWRKISPVQISAAILMRVRHKSGPLWFLHCRQSSRLPLDKNSKTNALASRHTPIRVTSSSFWELAWRSLFFSCALFSLAFCSSLRIWTCSFSRTVFSLDCSSR